MSQSNTETIEQQEDIVGELELEPLEVKPVAVVSESLPASGGADTSAFLSIIERISLMPEIDDKVLDRVERMYDLHQKMMAEQKEVAFNTAMAKAQQRIEPVSANCQSDHAGPYANLSAVHKVAKPIWCEEGFSVISSFEPGCTREGWIIVRTEIRHSAGHMVVKQNEYPLDSTTPQGKVNKTPIQAMGSTGTYARRYAECMAFDISIAGEDKDGNSPQKVKPAERALTNAQITTLREAMTMANVGDEEVCKRAQIQRIEDLQQGRLQGMINMLKKYAQGSQNVNS